VHYYYYSDVNRAINGLLSVKFVGPDEIPNFIIKGCAEIFRPTAPLRHIFNLSLLIGNSPSLWKQAVVMPKETALIAPSRF
jgi:hypothetical protein